MCGMVLNPSCYEWMIAFELRLNSVKNAYGMSLRSIKQIFNGNGFRWFILMNANPIDNMAHTPIKFVFFQMEDSCTSIPKSLRMLTISLLVLIGIQSKKDNLSKSNILI